MNLLGDQNQTSPGSAVTKEAFERERNISALGDWDRP